MALVLHELQQQGLLLADGSLGHTRRLLGAHFRGPVHAVRLLPPQCLQATRAALLELLRQLRVLAAPLQLLLTPHRRHLLLVGRANALRLLLGVHGGLGDGDAALEVRRVLRVLLVQVRDQGLRLLGVAGTDGAQVRVRAVVELRRLQLGDLAAVQVALLGLAASSQALLQRRTLPRALVLQLVRQPVDLLLVLCHDAGALLFHGLGGLADCLLRGDALGLGVRSGLHGSRQPLVLLRRLDAVHEARVAGGLRCIRRLLQLALLLDFQLASTACGTQSQTLLQGSLLPAALHLGTRVEVVELAVVGCADGLHVLRDVVLRIQAGIRLLLRGFRLQVVELRGMVGLHLCLLRRLLVRELLRRPGLRLSDLALQPLLRTLREAALQVGGLATALHLHGGVQLGLAVFELRHEPGSLFLRDVGAGQCGLGSLATALLLLRCRSAVAVLLLVELGLGLGVLCLHDGLDAGRGLTGHSGRDSSHLRRVGHGVRVAAPVVGQGSAGRLVAVALVQQPRELVHGVLQARPGVVALRVPLGLLDLASQRADDRVLVGTHGAALVVDGALERVEVAQQVQHVLHEQLQLHVQAVAGLHSDSGGTAIVVLLLCGGRLLEESAQRVAEVRWEGDDAIVEGAEVAHQLLDELVERPCQAQHGLQTLRHVAALVQEASLAGGRQEAHRVATAIPLLLHTRGEGVDAGEQLAEELQHLVGGRGRLVGVVRRLCVVRQRLVLVEQQDALLLRRQLGHDGVADDAWAVLQALDEQVQSRQDAVLVARHVAVVQRPSRQLRLDPTQQAGLLRVGSRTTCRRHRGGLFHCRRGQQPLDGVGLVVQFLEQRRRVLGLPVEGLVVHVVVVLQPLHDLPQVQVLGVPAVQLLATSSGRERELDVRIVLALVGSAGEEQRAGCRGGSRVLQQLQLGLGDDAALGVELVELQRLDGVAVPRLHLLAGLPLARLEVVQQEHGDADDGEHDEHEADDQRPVRRLDDVARLLDADLDERRRGHRHDGSGCRARRAGFHDTDDGSLVGIGAGAEHVDAWLGERVAEQLHGARGPRQLRQVAELAVVEAGVGVQQ